MKPTITVVHKEGKAEQSYKLKAIDGLMLGNIRYTLYESDNFFGYPVTLGVQEVQGRDSNDLSHFQITVKAAVCSEEDTYKPEIGRSLVLGRLMQSAIEGFQIANVDEDSLDYQSVVEAYVQSMATKLKEYLLTRDSMVELHKMSKQVSLQTLSQEFQEFK